MNVTSKFDGVIGDYVILRGAAFDCCGRVVECSSRNAMWFYKVKWNDIAQGLPIAATWHRETDLIACNPRLTAAETAVIDAALAQTGPRSPRLAMALVCLRHERGLSRPEETAAKVVADAWLPGHNED